MIRRALLAGLAVLAFTGLAARPALASAPASPAQLTAGLAQVIHADNASSVVDPATHREVLFMGDATMVNGRSYGTAADWWYPHFEMVDHAPGSDSFRVIPGSGQCRCQVGPAWADGSFFWPGGALATLSTIYVYGQQITMTSSGFTVDAGWAAKFSASSLAYEGAVRLGTSLALSSAVAWPGGHWMIGTAGSSVKTGWAVWVPAGDEARSAAWRTFQTLPASLDLGTVVSAFRWDSRWYAVTKQGDAYNGSALEELTASCMAGCGWHLTGKTWPTDMSQGVTYSAQVHADPPPAAGELIVSYAVNGTRYWPEFEAVQP